ncbi:hypothetical protein EHS25_000959 [Saitozyma podzolica]|uniref:Uncharacterized protein n=1 Tax=Saitozyma podzolica TaxID=1890683 RepID=A0A427YXQ6_9TREE|nr:hypothetical protein EHS25_000959 [Saitozyma podzolica]
MVCQRQPQKPSTRFLPLPDVPDVSPPLTGYDPRRRRFSVSSTTYDPQNALPSPLILGASLSLASTFTAQTQDDLLTPTDVVEASSASAATDPFFAYHYAQPECSGPSTRRLPVDPCSASSPPLYSDGLEWGSHLWLRAEEHALPYPRDVPFTFEHSHSGTALSLYIPQTDEPSGSRPWGASMDSTMNRKPEPEQTRAIRAMSAQASYPSSSHGRQARFFAVSRDSLTRSCSPRRRPSLPPPDKPLWPGEEWLGPREDRLGLQRDDAAGSK